MYSQIVFEVKKTANIKGLVLTIKFKHTHAPTSIAFTHHGGALHTYIKQVTLDMWRAIGEQNNSNKQKGVEGEQTKIANQLQ